MSYINENNMVLISPTSTNPQECTRKVDNVFKMSPIDTRYSKSVAALLEKMGISTIVVLYRGDAWADGIMDTFQREYDGEIVEIRYPGETTGIGFDDYLLQTEKAVQKAITEKGVDEVAVLILSFREALDILEIVEDYPV